MKTPTMTAAQNETFVSLAAQAARWGATAEVTLYTRAQQLAFVEVARPGDEKAMCICIRPDGVWHREC